MVTLYVKIVFGSTTAITGGVQFTLPTNAHSTMNALQFYSGSFTDSGARTIGSVGQITNTLDKVTVLFQDDAAGYIDLFTLTSTTPWTWTTSDEMQFLITYRKA